MVANVYGDLKYLGPRYCVSKIIELVRPYSLVGKKLHNCDLRTSYLPKIISWIDNEQWRFYAFHKFLRKETLVDDSVQFKSYS